MSNVVIKSTENGPNLVVVDGRVVQAWRRCGGSTMMPYCDGSHKRNDFKAQPYEVEVSPTRAGRAKDPAWMVR